MKRFWLFLLSLGLIMAFSVSAFAVDVKKSALKLRRTVYDEDDSKCCYVNYYIYHCVLCFGMRRGIKRVVQ
ncbi:hypothetical protein DS62_04120 [Smithella sp. SC_K08D17]|nr:hypothetical protein DS62_04120 [Smithella sp. SC_K08D17]